MGDTQAPAASAKRSRSPRYPSLSLDTAIERARVLYQREKKHAAPAVEVVRHWNLSPGSSSANLSVASLKAFGLLVDQGSGESRLLRLSELAIEILLNPNERQVQEAVRTAALTPRLHRELYEKYKDDLPSNAVLKYELIKERGFTESGAQDFISQLRKTFTYALSGSADSVDLEDAEPEIDTSEVDAVGPTRSTHTAAPAGHTFHNPAATPHVQTPPAAGMSIPIPLTGGTPVHITGNFPISEAAWQQLLRVLEAMKPGLVAEPQPDSVPQD